MTNQDTLRNLLIAAIVFVLLMAVGNVFLRPLDQNTTRPPEDQAWVGPTREDSPDVGPKPAIADRPQDAQAGDASDDQVFTVSEFAQEQVVSLGSAPVNGVETSPEDSPYRMRLVLSNVGASIASATMTDHAEELHQPERYRLLSPVQRADDGVVHRSLVTEKIRIDGVDLLLADKRWYVETTHDEAAREDTARFWVDILKDGKPALRITRIFTVPEQERKLKRHDLKSDLIIESLSAENHRVAVIYRGGLGVRQDNPRFPDQFVDWGTWDGQRIVGQRTAHADVAKNAAQGYTLYQPGMGDSNTRLSWAATANTYFTCTIAPLNRDLTDNAQYLAHVSAVDLDGSEATEDDVTLRFITTEQNLPAGQRINFPAAIYLGEKEGKGFQTVSEYRNRNYYFQISKGYGICTFTWLVELMIWLLNSLSFATRDFGIAIIILVLIVRTLLHPITKKGQVNMVRMQHKMQSLAPKIEEIKKKYANDKARMNQEMMKLNINPAGQMITCLPMMIQMPIWVALYISLSNNILMRHEPFLFSWIHDLTAQDALYTFQTPVRIPLFGWELPSFNLLPLLVSVFMYTQQKLQPKPKPNPNATDQQRQQQEMMQTMMPLMSIMMLLIFYKMPSGLNLYIMSSSLFGTIEQWRIRAHIREREEDGTLHKPEQRQIEKPAHATKPRKKGFLAKLKAMAEEAQKDQLRRGKKVRKDRS